MYRYEVFKGWHESQLLDIWNSFVIVLNRYGVWYMVFTDIEHLYVTDVICFKSSLFLSF